MTEEQEERLVVAFELIAGALTGIHDTQEKQFAKQWPERKEVREAVYSRVPTEEDILREQHGASEGTTEEWLTIEEEYVGPREREFLESASPKTGNKDVEDSGSVETPEGEA